MKESIFQQYYQQTEFFDRKEGSREKGVDVVIPIRNTNELWKNNLYNFFKVIPINRLLIGDGGCTDQSIEIVKKFPRVSIYDQRDCKTLGYRIGKLIEKVETDWFVYLHSDVFLPMDWYDKMVQHQAEYDYFECFRKITLLIEYPEYEQHNSRRPFSGSQMGRRDAFRNIRKIDDDYSERQEDMIFGGLLKAKGYRYGKVENTYLNHQIMNKGGHEPDYASVIIKMKEDKDWEKEICEMQMKGIIKYLMPGEDYAMINVEYSLSTLMERKAIDMKKFMKWVKQTNPLWYKYIKKMKRIRRIKIFFKKIYFFFYSKMGG